MVAAVRLPGGCSLSKSGPQARCCLSHVPKIIPSLQLTLPDSYPNREYGLILLLGKVGFQPIEKTVWDGECRGLTED